MPFYYKSLREVETVGVTGLGRRETTKVSVMSAGVTYTHDCCYDLRQGTPAISVAEGLVEPDAGPRQGCRRGSNPGNTLGQFLSPS